MLRRFSTIFTLSFLLVAFIAMTAFAANKPVDKRSSGSRLVKSIYYSYPDESVSQDPVGSTAALGKSVYSLSAAGVSPGVPFGDTWYDYQHNSTVGRMIDWGDDPFSSGHALIHFGWMRLPGAALAQRAYAYNYYNSDLGNLGGVSVIQAPDEYAGYVNVQSTNAGAAIVGGHNKPSAGYASQFYYDGGAGSEFWSQSSRVPDSVQIWDGTSGGAAGQEVIWPKFAYQEGTDTVTHVISQVFGSDLSVADGIYYFRKVGIANNGIWDYPPYIVDSIFTSSHDIVASKTSDKVAIAWTANLNYIPGDPNDEQYAVGVCDTCSGVTPSAWKRWENDVYFQTSDDQGATWNPKQNITKYRSGLGFFAYAEISITLDVSDNFHILWNGVPWPENRDDFGPDNSCRLYHWSEDVPFQRVVADANWPAEDLDCSAGGFNVNMSKVSLSECDGKMYAMWVQVNDWPNGIYDDCAARAATDRFGSANGELYLSVSSDNGTTWDSPRNLTNSRTPGCGPGDGLGDCESDSWPSMTRYGRQNKAGEDWLSAIVVDPSGGTYAGDYYLDIQYVHDRDAGGIVMDEGTWQLSNMNWFRLACVEPIPNPLISFSPRVVEIPTWVKPSEFLDIDLTIENFGNVALSYSTTVVEDNGTPGWLAVSGLSGSVPSGLSNVEIGTLSLNNGGVQTTEALLVGSVIFDSNAPTTPDTLHVSLLVVDTLVAATPDTVSGYLSLAVSTSGNYGNSGDFRINLDFVTNGADCDTTAQVYLYDGSPVILPNDTTLYSSIFDNGWTTPNGFKPQVEGSFSGSQPTYNWYTTGTFVTPDSTIAFEQTFYAPTANGASYMVKALKVWSHDGAAHSGLRIGDAIDWDIPSDSGAENGSAIDPLATRNLIYQIGREYDQDDTLNDGTLDPTGTDCIDDDRRFGGMAFLKSVLNGTDHNDAPASAYTARNDSFVFPNANFVPKQLWDNMGSSGFTIADSAEDLHMVMCYEPSFNLGASDTIVFYISLVTILDGVAADVGTVADDAEAFAIANSYWPDGPPVPKPPVVSDIPDQSVVVGDPFVAVDLNTYVADADNTDAEITWTYAGNTNLSVAIDGGNIATITAPNGTWLGSEAITFTATDPDGLFDSDIATFTVHSASCCVLRGDVNGSGSINVSDLVYLVAYSFQSGPAPTCEEHGDVNGSGSINVSDLVYLVAYSFQSGPAPAPCN